MARSVILSNGSMAVGLNDQGLVNDFYYPYVGLDNLCSARSTPHKIGIWADGIFSWVDDGSWEISASFDDKSLVSNITMQNSSLKCKLHFSDFVDQSSNAFCRRITVVNLGSEERELRLFMHQFFEISRSGRADTALFVPDENYLLDYKGRCSLLIYGEHDGGTVFDQYAIGNYGIEGKEGTFRDAEDGELSGSPVEHGGVDSVLRFKMNLDRHGKTIINYWVVAADSQQTAERIHQNIKKEGLVSRLHDTKVFWHKWQQISSPRIDSIEERYKASANKSLMVIKAHMDKRGGVIASCDSSIYNYGRDYYSYVWPRDGAYAIWPLIRLGFKEEALRFFEFCRDILTPGGYLMHKYQPDKAIGSTWHPLLHNKHKELAIQEDETAIVVYMLGEYYKYSQDIDSVRNLYTTLIKPAATFMSSFIDDGTGLPHASYDLWEQKFLTTTYTTATVYRALLVAAEFADLFEFPDDGVAWRESAALIRKSAHVFFEPESGVLRKGFLLSHSGDIEFDNTLDTSSLYGSFIFDLYGKPELLDVTVNKIEQELVSQTPIGGSPRYEYDDYFASNPPHKGNPWFVTTLWLAQYYARHKRSDKARLLIDWSLEHATSSGVMSEQANPNSGIGISVTPLVWSHAEFVNAILDLGTYP